MTLGWTSWSLFPRHLECWESWSYSACSGIPTAPRTAAPKPPAATGQTIAYEQISGRAFGELNPADPLNAIIQDIDLSKDAGGKVRYTASFVLTKPVDMSNASGLLWHDVPNRGSPITIVVAERNFGDIGLASAWQGQWVSRPGLRSTVPEADFIMPVLDYDWGPLVNYTDASGIPTNAPPPIRQAIRMLVPRVDADGNEIGGVPNVLTDAPLGTYLGWNIAAGGARPFHQGQICNYVGGMIPFAKTRTERLLAGDPRLSLEQRYGSHAGYIGAVANAAANAVARGFLLQADADVLIAAADASQVLKQIRTSPRPGRDAMRRSPGLLLGLDNSWLI